MGLCTLSFYPVEYPEFLKRRKKKTERDIGKTQKLEEKQGKHTDLKRNRKGTEIERDIAKTQLSLIEQNRVIQNTKLCNTF